MAGIARSQLIREKLLLSSVTYRGVPSWPGIASVLFESWPGRIAVVMFSPLDERLADLRLLGMMQLRYELKVLDFDP